MTDWDPSKVFANRADAGRRLAEHLSERLGLPGAPAGSGGQSDGLPDGLVVVGVTRGGVPVALEVAKRLRAPLDVIAVGKIGVPFMPELAMGAVAEGGGLYVDGAIVGEAGVRADEVAQAGRRAHEEVAGLAERYRRSRPRLSPAERMVVVVDDGLATGATAAAACRAVRACGARKVVVAVPVSPPETVRALWSEADDVIAVETPRDFLSIDQWYAAFDDVTDADVVRCLDEADRPAAQPPTAQVRKPRAAVPACGHAGARAAHRSHGEHVVPITTDGVRLHGDLVVPSDPSGLVVLAHGGNGRHNPRSRQLAAHLSDAGLASLLVDLLTPHERSWLANLRDVDLLAHRLAAATRSVADDFAWVAYLATGTGAAAALRTAAEAGHDVAAVVARNGRTDLAAPWLGDVRAPTLLIVDGDDQRVLRINREALERLRCPSDLTVVPRSDNPTAPARDMIARRALDWILNRSADVTGHAARGHASR